MNLRRLVSTLSFAFAALPFFASGCASTEEETLPESPEVNEDVVDRDGVGLEPNICYMCFKCPRKTQQYCSWGGGEAIAQCDDNCVADCVWVSTSQCG